MSNKQWEVHAAKLTSDPAVTALTDLARAEGELEQVKRQKNKQRQQEIERQIHGICASLARDWPHAFYAYLKAIGSSSSDVLREEWKQMIGRQSSNGQISNGLEWLRSLEIERPLEHNFTILPNYTFALEFQFVLAKPYLSQDDDAFYVIDNPVRKDKVFKVPCVAPTSWKGSLRAAATRGLLDVLANILPSAPPAGEQERAALLQKLWAERARRIALFGNEKENQAAFLNRWLASRLLPEQPDQSAEERRKQVQEEADRLGQEFEQYLIQHGYRTEKIEGRQGRLFCFPTFFNRIDLEIINPHDRERRVGKNPILLESVPAEAKGTFRLLYVPYDFPGEVAPDEAALQQQIQADLPIVAEAIRDLLTVYGFGAKTSSGFGAAEDQLAGEGKLVIRAKLAGEAYAPGAPPEPQQPALPRYLEAPNRLHPDFRRPDGSLKSEEEYRTLIESRGGKYTKKDKRLYAKAKKWWEREGRALAEAASEEPEPEPQPVPAETLPVSEYTFHSISELCEVAQRVAVQLREGGAA